MAIHIQIDGYDNFEQIAVGGMAAVYKARQVSIDKTVAIKILFPYLANDPSFIERFQREARAAAKIQHESIVNVSDFGESHGSYYIVMEYYHGVTIAELLKQRSRVPIDVAASILLEVCLGLEAAHAENIVHRDIKPANIIYTKQGGIKVADFGLAKKTDAMTVVTQAGKVLGTPAYMSPEQAAAKDVGPQSDIFSLGVVAYELFCNRRPFEGDSYSEVIEKIQTFSAPSLTHENPLIQPDFENMVRKMLEKGLDERYASISDVITDLEKAMEGHGFKRDHRRLKRYVKDPESYEKAFTEKMVSKCLSKGTYYMQQGKTHIADAIQEFKRILYLDPMNERARTHLNKLLAQHEGENATVVLEATEIPKPPEKATAKPIASKPAPGKKKRTVSRQKSSRRWMGVALVTAIIAGGGYAGWWGWTTLQASNSGNAAPVLSAPANLTVTEGESVSFSLGVLDPEGDPVNVYGNDLPDGAALSRDGRFEWQVGYDQAGEHTIELYGNDGTSTGKTEVRITVLDNALSLSFEAIGEKSARVGQRVTVGLKASSEFGDDVTFSLENAPRGMTVSGKRISWTPARNQTGTYRIGVRGSDGRAESERTLVVRVKDRQQPVVSEKGRVEWVLPKLANIYVDGRLKVREDTYLSIGLTAGKHTIRAELMDGMTAFEEVVSVKSGRKITLDPPRIAYGKLSVYFLGGVGELKINGKKFKQQPPFTGVVVPVGTYAVAFVMFHEKDSRSFSVDVKEEQATVIEYEVGSEPAIGYESIDG